MEQVVHITTITADTHFGHGNIIRYERPHLLSCGDLTSDGQWVSKEIKNLRTRQMDDLLIDNWNSVVEPSDNVLHLGDFAFDNVESYLKRLNGHIYFVTGNHDRQMLDYIHRHKQNKVTHLGNLKDIKTELFSATVCHFAMRVWNRSHYGQYHLYGHSHGNLPETNDSLSMDVGVDAAFKRFGKLRPFTIREIQEILNKRTFVPVDHHGSYN